MRCAVVDPDVVAVLALTCCNRLSVYLVFVKGRGTSTEDGVAVALATLEYLTLETRCLTLFVTHYPEIPAAVEQAPLNDGSVRLGRMVVLEGAGDAASSSVTFLHRLEPGAATASFGLNVARMAGVPESVVSRAKLLASGFEGLRPLLGQVRSVSGAGDGARGLKALQAQIADTLLVLNR